MMAVAAAAFEEEVVNGWGPARNDIRAALLEAADRSEAEVNPFGPDPARAASMGRPDDGHYTATAPIHEADMPPMPPRPVTAGGVNF